MEAVNLPLALFTIVLRRFIDKFRNYQRTTHSAAALVPSVRWFGDNAYLRPCMYGYMFICLLYYAIKHMRRGTIVSVARTCSAGVLAIKETCSRRRWASKSNSWIERNLRNGRDGQQEALRYVASMAEDLRLSSPVSNNGPLFEPRNLSNNAFNKEILPFSSSTQVRQTPKLDIIMEPSTSTNASILKSNFGTGDFTETCNHDQLDRSEFTGLSPVGDLQTPIVGRRRRGRPRNHLTLRRLKRDFKTNLNSAKKIVRTTRSGKVYGYLTELPGCNRKKYGYNRKFDL